MSNVPPERRSETGKPMVAGTPKDVMHLRVGSFVVFLAIFLSVIALISGAVVLAVALWVLAVAGIVDVVLALRRQKRLGGGPDSLA